MNKREKEERYRELEGRTSRDLADVIIQAEEALDKRSAKIGRLRRLAYEGFDGLARALADMLGSPSVAKSSTYAKLKALCERAEKLRSQIQEHPRRVEEADETKLLREAADTIETLLSSEPQMPTYKETIDEADSFLERLRNHLGE